MRKRKYSRRKIKVLAFQAAARALSNQDFVRSCADETFICETRYDRVDHDDYPYRTEFDMEVMYIAETLRKRMAKLSMKEW